MTYKKPPDARQMRKLRLRVAAFVSSASVVGTFFILGIVGISPISISGLLILASVAALLWQFWRDTLASVRRIRAQEQRQQQGHPLETARSEQEP